MTSNRKAVKASNYQTVETASAAPQPKLKPVRPPRLTRESVKYAQENELSIIGVFQGVGKRMTVEREMLKRLLDAVMLRDEAINAVIITGNKKLEKDHVSIVALRKMLSRVGVTVVG